MHYIALYIPLFLFLAIFSPCSLYAFLQPDTIIQIPTTKQALIDILDIQSAGDQGAFVLTKSVRGEFPQSAFYLYHITPDGQLPWGQHGLLVLSPHFEPINGKIISISQQQISLLLLVKSKNQLYSLIFQQVSFYGFPKFQQNGIPLFSSTKPITDFHGSLFEPNLLFFAFILANQKLSYQLYEIHKQRPETPVTSLHVSTQSFSLLQNLQLMPADRNSILISWQAFTGTYWHTFINKINKNGDKEWGTYGLYLYNNLKANIEHFSWINDGFGGIIAAFTTQNLKGNFLYVLRATRQGQIIYLKEIPLFFQNLTGTTLWKTGTSFFVFISGWTGIKGYLSSIQFSIYSGTQIKPETIFYTSNHHITSLNLLSSPLSDIIHLIWNEENGQTFTTRYSPENKISVQSLAYKNELTYFCDDFNGGFWLLKQKINLVTYAHFKENGLTHFPEDTLNRPPSYSYASLSHILSTPINNNQLLIWADNRNQDENIFATILNPQGIPITPPEGIPLITSQGKNIPRSVLFYQDRIFLLWSNANSRLTQWLYLSCYDTTFTPLWTKPKLICDDQTDQISPMMIPIQSYLLIIWGDSRHFESTGFDVYSQLITLNGTILWEQNGRPLLAEPYYETEAKILPISSDTLLLAWLEDANSHFQLRYRFYSFHNAVLTPLFEGYVWPSQNHQRQYQFTLFNQTILWVWTQSYNEDKRSQILARPMLLNGYWDNHVPIPISHANSRHLFPQLHPHEKSLLITWFQQPSLNEKFYFLQAQFFRYHWSKSFWESGGATLTTGIPLFSPVTAQEYRSSSLIAWFHLSNSSVSLKLGRLFAPYSPAQLKVQSLYQSLNLLPDYLTSWLNENHHFLLCKEKIGEGNHLLLFHQEL